MGALATRARETRSASGERSFGRLTECVLLGIFVTGDPDVLSGPGVCGGGRTRRHLTLDGAQDYRADGRCRGRDTILVTKGVEWILVEMLGTFGGRSGRGGGL